MFWQIYFFKNNLKPSVYAALSDFCVISYECNEYLCSPKLSEF